MIIWKDLNCSEKYTKRFCMRWESEQARTLGNFWFRTGAICHSTPPNIAKGIIPHQKINSPLIYENYQGVKIVLGQPIEHLFQPFTVAIHWALLAPSCVSGHVGIWGIEGSAIRYPLWLRISSFWYLSRSNTRTILVPVFKTRPIFFCAACRLEKRQKHVSLEKHKPKIYLPISSTWYKFGWIITLVCTFWSIWLITFSSMRWNFQVVTDGLGYLEGIEYRSIFRGCWRDRICSNHGERTTVLMFEIFVFKRLSRGSWRIYPCTSCPGRCLIIKISQPTWANMSWKNELTDEGPAVPEGGPHPPILNRIIPSQDRVLDYQSWPSLDTKKLKQ